jgi:hypothetical protein
MRTESHAFDHTINTSPVTFAIAELSAIQDKDGRSS